jgi:hypothetical protein
MKIAIITAVAPASISVVRTSPVPAIPSRRPVTVAASNSAAQPAAFRAVSISTTSPGISTQVSPPL